MDTMLELKNVCKTFNPGTVNEKKALTGLNLSLKHGDFATIVGSNGAGKSTMFNAITGSFFTDEGAIILDGEDISGTIKNMMESAIDSALDDYIGISEIPEDWNIRAITEFANQYLNAQGEFKIPEEDMETITKADVKDMLMELGNKRYESQEEVFGENMRELERVLMLRVVDTLWMDHLDEMEHVKREIGLRAYGQHDPVLEYRNVGSELYENMLDSIKKDTVRYVLSAMPRVKIEREQVAKPLDTGGDGSLGNTPKRAKKEPGRNDPCPCGSGKKYKNCCGKNK